jgi:hypothetical protein
VAIVKERETTLLGQLEATPPRAGALSAGQTLSSGLTDITGMLLVFGAAIPSLSLLSFRKGNG